MEKNLDANLTLPISIIMKESLSKFNHLWVQAHQDLDYKNWLGNKKNMKSCNVKIIYCNNFVKNYVVGIFLSNFLLLYDVVYDHIQI